MTGANSGRLWHDASDSVRKSPLCSKGFMLIESKKQPVSSRGTGEKATTDRRTHLQQNRFVVRIHLLWWGFWIIYGVAGIRSLGSWRVTGHIYIGEKDGVMSG